MNTIVGLFESRAKARHAKGALIRAHIASPNISLYDRSSADSSKQAEQSLWESLKDALGFAEDRSFYDEGMRRGGTVVSVRVNEEQMNHAAEILSRQGAVDLNNTERAKSGRLEEIPKDSEAVPVVEEDPQAGTRDMVGGKVRVYKRAA